MGTTGSNFNLARVPLIDKNGMATRDFLLWLQQLQAKTDQSLTLAGEVVGDISGDFSGTLTDAAQVQGAPGSLAAQVANLDANGIVMINGLDMSRAYVGKLAANIPYASGASVESLKPAQAGADVTANNTSALTASLSNQTQDALGPGLRYGQYVLGSNFENMIANSVFTYDAAGKQAAGWTGSGSVVSDTLPNGATGNCLKVTSQNYAGEIIANSFALIPGQTYRFSAWIKTGGAGYWNFYRGNYGDAGNVILPGAPTAWTFVSGTFTLASNSAETNGAMLVLNAAAASDWLEIWGASAVKVRNLDNEVADGDSRFACLVKALANADGLPAGTVYAILAQARANAGLDPNGNLLFKSIETGTITTGISIGSVVALSSVVSITTVGKPVKINGIINCTGGATASAVGLQIYRDGSPLAGVGEMGSVWFPAGAADSKPVDYLDNAPSAGPHTYQLYGFNNGGPNATTQGGNLSVWEYA